MFTHSISDPSGREIISSSLATRFLSHSFCFRPPIFVQSIRFRHGLCLAHEYSAIRFFPVRPPRGLVEYASLYYLTWLRYSSAALADNYVRVVIVI